MNSLTCYAAIELKESGVTRGYIVEPCYFVRSHYWNTEKKGHTEHTIIVPYTNYEEFKQYGFCEPSLKTRVTPMIFDSFEEAQMYASEKNYELEDQISQNEFSLVKKFEKYANEQMSLLQEEKKLIKTDHKVI